MQNSKSKKISIASFRFYHCIWGDIYFQQFLWKESFENFSFEAIFETLKAAHFFSEKPFIEIRDIDKNLLYTYKEITSDNAAVYGPYNILKCSSEDFIQLNAADFFNRIESCIDEQNEFRLNYPEIDFDIEKIKRHIAGLIRLHLAESFFFYELHVDESDTEKIMLPGIWDYFKGFIGFDIQRNHVIRIEMGRD